MDEALIFCRMLNLSLRTVGANASVALAGSVLMKGESKKDLDLILFPYTSVGYNVGKLKNDLACIGMKCVFDRAFVTEMWRKQGSDDSKHVEVWTFAVGEWAGKRVDFFFLNP